MTSSHRVVYAYDDLGRVLTQTTWANASGTDTPIFTKTMTWNQDGTPGTVAEGGTTLTYVYDPAGRPSQFKNGATQLTAWTYNLDTSTVATRTDGTSNTTTFGYDWARRATSITPSTGTFAGAGTVTRTYRLDGTLATQALPSSITETLAYDPVKRPTSIAVGSAGSLSQSFDRAGRVTSDGRGLTGISGDPGTGTQAFSYDGLSRLTGSSGLTASTSNAYDLDGNRTTRTEGSTTTTFTYDLTDEIKDQSIAGTPHSYSYDQFGNLKTAWDRANTTTTYDYDEANRLVAINAPGGAPNEITFTIDPLDRHATRAVGGTTSDNYGYVGATETAWQTGATTAVTSALLDDDGSRLAIKTGTGGITWLIFDLHGSVVALCPAGGTTLSDAYRYDGFGQLLASAGTAVNPWRYRGLLNIGASDGLTWALLDMGARDYSAQLGAFTQEDSVQGAAANPLSMNRYLYALANPATLVDPDGHFAMEYDSDAYSAAGTCRHIGDPGCGRTASSPTARVHAATHHTSKYAKNPCVGSCNKSRYACDRGCERGSSAPSAEAGDCGLIGLACSDPNGLGGTLAGIGEGACNLTLCGAWQLITKPGETIGGIGNVLSTDWNSITSGHALNDLSAGWDAMWGMSAHDKAEFWTDVIGGGFLAGRGISAATATSVARGGAAPVAQGAAGVERTVADLEAAGGTVLGREVTIEAGGVRARPDLYVRLPNGQEVFIEVKTGPAATLTRNQSTAYPDVIANGFTPYGGNAASTGVLTPGVQYGPTQVWVVHQPWPLP